MIELPTLANGRYAVKRYLGQGGMAAVFLVYDNTFEDRRAIKVLNPSLVTRPAIQARFRTEAQAMARLNHPNIVRVYDHGMEGITSYIVMDYLPHGSLQDHLEANGPLDREEALSMAIDLSKALEHAHEAGIIHRDVKPGNALLSPRGLLLTDFGLARVADLSDGSTRTRAVMGTPAYMSPEQRLSAKNATHHTDIYALAATLFVMLTQKDPIDLYDETEQVDLLDGLDADLAEVIRKGCHADLTQRFSTAAQLTAALESLRSVPNAPRTPPANLQPRDASTSADIPSLHQLWSSYTNPSDAESMVGQRRPSETMGLSYLDDEEEVGEAETPETLVPTVSGTTPSEPPSTPPAAPPAPAVPPAQPASLKWLVLPAALVLVLVGVVAVSRNQPTAVQPPPFAMVDMEGEQVAASYEQARSDLLAGNVRTAMLSLQSLAEAHPSNAPMSALYGMAAFCHGRKTVANDALGRAAISSREETGVLAQSLAFWAQSHEQDTVTSMEAEWLSIQGDTPSAELDLLYMVTLWPHASDEDLFRALQSAQQRHPQAAIFAVLEVLHRQQGIQTQSERVGFVEALSAILTSFPNATALLRVRGHSLFHNAEYAAAKEVMQAVLRADANDGDALLVLGDLAAIQGDESSRFEQLMKVLGDEVPREEWFHFAQQHGLMLTGVGLVHDAEKLWALAEVERRPGEPPARSAADEVAILHAKLRVHADADPQWRAALTRQRDALTGLNMAEAERGALLGELAYLEAVSDLRQGNAEAVARGKEQLSAQMADGDVHARLLHDLLSLEEGLLTQSGDAETLLALHSRIDVQRNPCVAQWAEARVMAALIAAGDGERLTRLQAIADGLAENTCMAPPEQFVPLQAEVNLLLAEAAQSQGKTNVNRTAHERFVRLWPEADSSLSFVQRMALAHPPSDSP